MKTNTSYNPTKSMISKGITRNLKFILAIICAASLIMNTNTKAQIAAWDFTGAGNYVSFAATYFNPNLVSANNLITRGSGAPASAGANSFRTQGFGDNTFPIATTNTDYFQITLGAVTGYKLSLSTIDAKFNGTATFYAAPGVTSRFAYSLNGGANKTLIGSNVTSTSLTMNQINLSGISALQNVPAGTTITLYYYANGQTNSGGWGFYSSVAGSNGLAIGGTLTPVAVANSITTSPIIGSPFNPGAAVSVPYTITGTFNSGNIFTAQLSDALGSFASPATIGTLPSIVAGTIIANPGVIPIGTPAGTGYRIRVISNNPAITGTDNGVNLTVNVPSNTWAILSAGFYHTLALGSDGKLFSWGYNQYSQLGNGNTTNQKSPFLVPNTTPGTTWVSIAAGQSHSIAVKSDGTLWAWGSNSNGQLGLGNTSQKTTPFLVPSTPGNNSPWQKVFAGAQSSFGIKADGTLWAWGSNSSAQLGDGTKINKTSPVQIGGAGIKWASVSSGLYHTFAIDVLGHLWGWGYNWNGQLSAANMGNTYVTPFSFVGTYKAVSAGYHHSLAISFNGNLYACGGNLSGEIGDGTYGPFAIAAHWKNILPGINNWVSVFATDASYAIKSDGTLWAWGDNSWGQLGDGTKTNKYVPNQIGMATNWASISAGQQFGAALQSDKLNYCGTGDNTYGQFGDGTFTSKTTFSCQSLVTPRLANPTNSIQENNAEEDNLSISSKDRKNFSVFPNPSTSNFSIQLISEENTLAKLQLFNLLGEQGYSERKQILSGENTLQVITDNLSEGIYLLKVSAGEKNYNQKVIIYK